MNGRRGHERPRTSENKARFYDMIKEITRKSRNEEKRRTLVVLFPQPSKFFEIKYRVQLVTIWHANLGWSGQIQKENKKRFQKYFGVVL